MSIINFFKRICGRLRACVKRILGKSFPSDEIVIRVFKTRNEKILLDRIKKKERINVAFFCMSVPLWKYDTIFRAMSQDPYFNPFFFISPRPASFRTRKKVVNEMVRFCEQNKYNYVQLKNVFFNIGQNITKYAIDIAFYTQPYSNITPREYYYDRLKNSLLCYVPYGYLISKMKHNYTSLLNNIAWRVYMPTSVSKETAATFLEKTSNMLYLGYPGYDMYLSSEEYVWKKRGLKKIIWAPHHSIQKHDWIQLSSFLDICDYMIELAIKFKDEVQFVFKPHPHLYQALCSVWGAKRADEYYNLWAEMENTALCEGDGYPVFKSSDALIHDCASYLLDYIYTQKPCLYVSMSGHLNVETSEDGLAAYDAHYHANSLDGIEYFIQNVVIDGEDNMFLQRKYVLEEYLLPRTGKNATENIIINIKNSLKIDA